jgi:hypothetical protein
VSTANNARDLAERAAALERELTEQAARANAAVAAAQDKSYWLDRWHVDLNALMMRRGASEARAALRALRAVYRLLYQAGVKLRAASTNPGDRIRSARETVARDRATAQRLAADASEHQNQS